MPMKPFVSTSPSASCVSAMLCWSSLLVVVVSLQLQRRLAERAMLGRAVGAHALAVVRPPFFEIHGRALVAAQAEALQPGRAAGAESGRRAQLPGLEQRLPVGLSGDQRAAGAALKVHEH